MRLWLSLLLSAVLLAAGAASALAIPSVAGPTGIVNLPTANTAPANEVQFGVGYRSIEMYTDVDVSLWSFQVLKGVADDAELWVGYQRASNGEDTDVWEFGGKYLIGEDLFPRTGFLGGTKIAIGASMGRWTDAIGMYADDPLIPTDVETLRSYLVATKQIIPTYGGEWEWGEFPGTRIFGTAGLMYLRVSPGLGETDSLIEPFFGVEIMGTRNLTLALEYRLKDSDLEDDSVFSVLFRRPFGDSTIGEVGLTNASPIGLGQGKSDLFVRFGYRVPLVTGYR